MRHLGKIPVRYQFQLQFVAFLFCSISECHPLTLACLLTQAGDTRDDCLVSVGLDLMATCCDYAGITQPEHCLGLSLRSVAEATDPKAIVPRTYVYCENQVSYCVANASWKYVLYDHVSAFRPGVSPWELSWLH